MIELRGQQKKYIGEKAKEIARDYIHGMLVKDIKKKHKISNKGLYAVLKRTDSTV